MSEVQNVSKEPIQTIRAFLMDQDADYVAARLALDSLEEQLESVKRDGLRLRERLNQAEAFIDHLDANYRYEEWLGEEHEDDSNPASERQP